MTVKTAPTSPDRKQASRRKLLDAARQLFIERGYHDTRPQDIARLAGVGHGTFYLHFADKRECFFAFVEEAAEEVDKAVKPLLESAKSLEDLIRRILDGVHRYAEDHPGVLAAALTDPAMIDKGDSNRGLSLTDRWAVGWAGTVRELAKLGEVADDLDPVIMGHAIVGLLHQASIGASGEGLSRETLVNTVVPFIVRGLKKR